MKICHLINGFEAGGAQTFLMGLAIAQKKCHDIVIMSLNKINENDKFHSFIKEELEKNDIQVIDLKRKPGKNFSIMKSYTLAKNFLFNNDIDILNSHLPLSHLFTAVLFNNKYVHVNTVHNAPEKTSKITVFLNRTNPKIYCSKSAYELNKFPHIEYEIINNGIKFNKKELTNNDFNLHQELNIPDSSKIVMSVGAIREQKNYTFLIDLISTYYEGSNTHFIICGGFDKNKILYDLILKQKLKNLHFLGIQNEIFKFLQLSDIYLSCSLFEGLPIAVLEAFSSGIKCVLSPIEQHIMISEDMPYCYIPENFDLKSFKNEIDQSLEIEINKKEILADRDETIKKFNVENTAKKYIDFYQKLIDEK